MDVSLIFNSRAKAERKQSLAKAQAFVDKECVKEMTPYVPVARSYWRNAGQLRDSVRIVKPGVIAYETRFARSDYYNRKHVSHAHSGNPRAHDMWFEFMKRKSGEKIRRGAEKIVGDKV